MFLFKCSSPGDRSGGRFVPRADGAESGFVPLSDDVESGCFGRDDCRGLPEEVKKRTSRDVYGRSWVKQGEIERAPVPANGRPTNCVDEVFCFEVKSGETFSDSDYGSLNLQNSLSVDAATYRMSRQCL